METNQKRQITKDKLLIVFGKKPRASKTSKRFSYLGSNYFLYSNKVNTSGVALVFLDSPPYPLIAAIPRESNESFDEVHEWIRNNTKDIQVKLGDYRDRTQLDLESWFLINKNKKKLNRSFTIHEESKPFCKLTTIEIDGEWVYLWLDMKECPTKRSKMNNIIIDSELVKIEYLRRKEENATAS